MNKLPVPRDVITTNEQNARISYSGCVRRRLCSLVAVEVRTMERRGAKWHLIAALTVATCLGGGALSYAQFTSYSDHKRGMLEGNWQSCREDDGQYGERVYDGKWPGMPPFELHLGPYHEFALFRGVQDEHRAHNSTDNLLKPYNVEIRVNAARQSWDVYGLHLEIALAGGSREDCESWFVSLRRADTTASY
jgi:hypothetical protein